jgi:hypothetical protein
MPDERRIKFSKMLKEKSFQAEDFKAYGISWVIRDEADDLALGKLLDSGNFKEQQQFGKIKIYKLVN